jgi:ribonucleoside-diphosphate reductase alpha chain
MDSFGTSTSIALQYGVPLEVLVNKFSHTRFEPMGHTTNPDIRIAKSLVDYIFRWLGLTFLDSYRDEHKAKQESTSAVSKPAPAPTQVNGNGAEAPVAPSTGSYTKAKYVGFESIQARLTDAAPPRETTPRETTSSAPMSIAGKSESRDSQFASFQGDAPSCDNCGSITVRNGNCYLCHNCGNSLGCS